MLQSHDLASDLLLIVGAAVRLILLSAPTSALTLLSQRACPARHVYEDVFAYMDVGAGTAVLFQHKALGDLRT